MLEPSSASLNFHPVYKNYRFIALALYSVVLLATIIDWVYGGIGGGAFIFTPDYLKLSFFLFNLFILFTLELVGFGHRSFVPHEKPLWLAFVLRLVLLFSLLLLTDLNYSYILASVGILYCYLTFGPQLSYGLVLFFIITFLLLAANDMANPLPPSQMLEAEHLISPDFTQPNFDLGGFIDKSMGFFIIMFFTLLLARALSKTLKDKDELQDLNQSLEKSHSQLKQYSNRVADLAATEERNRLARDIHDSLGHHLTAMNIQLKKSQAYRQRDPELANEAVAHAQRTVEDALQDIRTSMKSLREESDAFEFDPALEALVKRMTHSELTIQLDKIGDNSAYSKLSLLTFYRVIQEGLTNIHKHSQANLVSIKLNFSDERALLDLSDNGQGFDVNAWEHQHKQSTSFGLQGLKERLTLLGGTLHISSQDKQTTLTARLPKVSH